MTRRELLASAMAATLVHANTSSRVSQLAAINDEIGPTLDDYIRAIGLPSRGALAQREGHSEGSNTLRKTPSR